MLEDLIIAILGAAFGVCAFLLGFVHGRLYERKGLTGQSFEFSPKAKIEARSGPKWVSGQAPLPRPPAVGRR
jgi:hypothetical protein